MLDKPGKGSFYATDLETILRARGITHLVVTGVTTEVCVQTTVARGQRPRLRLPGPLRLHRLLLPAVPRVGAAMFSAQGGIVGWVADAPRDLLAALETLRGGRRHDHHLLPAAREARRPPWWTKGDWNGLFGLGTNVLLNVIVLTGLCLGVVEDAGDTVYGRILPALGIALPLGNIWYAVLARRLARRENRDDVTALPYGPSVPHMFIVVFVVMLPVHLQSGDPLKAWRAGLAWAFIIGCIVLLGALFGPWIRRLTPRAALLGSLAGISHHVHLDEPGRADVAGTVDRVRRARLHPRRLARRPADAVRRAGRPARRSASPPPSAWIAVLAGLVRHPRAELGGVASLGKLALHLPFPGGDVLHGLRDIAPLLATAIPLGIYNFTEGMTNVESAAAAGDRYSVRQVLAADGLGAIVGSFLGSPFPPAVYIGHPGWKAVGGRIGYSLVTGIVVAARLLHRAGRHVPGDLPHAGPRAGAALHRPGDRRAGVQRQRPAVRARDRAGDAAEPRAVGHRARSTTRSRRPARRAQTVGDGHADRGRGHLRRPAAARAGRGARRHRARRDRLLRDRPADVRRRDHRGDRRRAVVRRARSTP